MKPSATRLAMPALAFIALATYCGGDGGEDLEDVTTVVETEQAVETREAADELHEQTEDVEQILEAGSRPSEHHVLPWPRA